MCIELYVFLSVVTVLSHDQSLCVFNTVKDASATVLPENEPKGFSAGFWTAHSAPRPQGRARKSKGRNRKGGSDKVGEKNLRTLSDVRRDVC